MTDNVLYSKATRSKVNGSYAPVNGLNLYDEGHSPRTGTPLIMLHGG
jgi:hypothetical protein